MNKYKLLREDFKKDWTVDDQNYITEEFLIKYFIDSANRVPGNNRSINNKVDIRWAYDQIIKCVDKGYIEPIDNSIFRYLNFKLPKFQVKLDWIFLFTAISAVTGIIQMIYAVLSYYRK